MTIIIVFLSILAGVAMPVCLVIASAFLLVSTGAYNGKLPPKLRVKVVYANALTDGGVEHMALMLALRWMLVASIPAAWLSAVAFWVLA